MSRSAVTVWEAADDAFRLCCVIGEQAAGKTASFEACDFADASGESVLVVGSFSSGCLEPRVRGGVFSVSDGQPSVSFLPPSGSPFTSALFVPPHPSRPERVFLTGHEDGSVLRWSLSGPQPEPLELPAAPLTHESAGRAVAPLELPQGYPTDGARPPVVAGVAGGLRLCFWDYEASALLRVVALPLRVRHVALLAPPTRPDDPDAEPPLFIATAASAGPGPAASLSVLDEEGALVPVASCPGPPCSALALGPLRGPAPPSLFLGRPDGSIAAWRPHDASAPPCPAPAAAAGVTSLCWLAGGPRSRGDALVVGTADGCVHVFAGGA
eukprot:tig00001471_g8869.t1